jgi:hypothetical protein
MINNTSAVHNMKSIWKFLNFIGGMGLEPW